MSSRLSSKKASTAVMVVLLLANLLVGCSRHWNGHDLIRHMHHSNFPISPTPQYNKYYRGRKDPEILFGLLSFPSEQANLVVTTGHLCLFQTSVVLPMIVGFYFTPGGRR